VPLVIFVVGTAASIACLWMVVKILDRPLEVEREFQQNDGMPAEKKEGPQ
jgi:hypothetical protein